ncbi:MAG: UDP-N-acetylmuramate dehydrogenase [Corynebacterium sp.]|nr:UDP-N-acetylmuramate dehydrogenase [Corynebacterium sp.]
MTQQLEEFVGVDVDYTTTFADMTTLRVGGKPRYTVRCYNADAASYAVRALDNDEVPIVIVGGGSNLVVADESLGKSDIDAVAVTLEFDQIQINKDSGIVRAGAGAQWDDVVQAAVDAGLGGIECLSGIPGKVGAVPVQNVGAYGTEISDVLTWVRLYDRHTEEDSWVPAESLDLSYRYSNLKFTQRAVVLAIELQLLTDGLSAPLNFRQLTDNPGERRPVAEIRNTVLELRRGKGMVLNANDKDTWSAGSFFTNPIVPSLQADRVVELVRSKLGDEEAAAMPRFPVGEDVKLSAAWLIERAGFKRGYPGTEEPARLSTRHTLAITNRGNANSRDIVSLARDIRDGVQGAFGVTLVPEPVWLECEI